jgi:hypothetical protein
MEFPAFYRLSSAMNNVGISLLQRGHYHLASSTIKETVNQLKSIIPDDDSDSKCQASREAGLARASSVNTKFLHAMRQLATLPIIKTSSTCIITSVSLIYEDIPSFLQVMQAKPTLYHLYPIRIEGTDTPDVHLLVAIMLYNYALSLQCIGHSRISHVNSSSSGSQSPVSTVLSRSCTILQLAQTIMEELCREQEYNGIQGVLVFCVAGMISKALSQILLYEHRSFEAMCALELMGRIVEVISRQETILPSSTQVAPAA